MYAGVLVLPWCALLFALQTGMAALHRHTSPLATALRHQVLCWTLASAWQPQALPGLLACGLMYLLTLFMVQLCALLARTRVLYWRVVAAAAVPVLAYLTWAIGPQAVHVGVLGAFAKCVRRQDFFRGAALR